MPAFSAGQKVKSIKLNKKAASLTVGKTLTLKAAVKPKNANKKVVWKSSDKKIASVSSKGKVTAKKVGKAVITCCSKKYPKIKATCKITVKPVAVKAISLSEESLSLTVGDSSTLTAKVDPVKATDPKVKWSSSDTKTATVDSGKVTAVAKGEAEITCESVKYPKIRAVCKVTVEEKVNADLEELEEIKMLLARTGEPLYQIKKGRRVSYKTGNNGYSIWSVAPNGITIRNDKNEKIGVTNRDRRGNPVLTMGFIDQYDDTADRMEALKNGTYDFASSARFEKIKIAWGIWDADTSKADFEKMINHPVSAPVFAAVKNTYAEPYWFTPGGGGSCIIIYGMNEKEELVGKFAGVTSYCMVSNATYMEVIGIDPENKECCGKTYSENVAW